jgi:hypothetical protein
LPDTAALLKHRYQSDKGIAHSNSFLSLHILNAAVDNISQVFEPVRASSEFSTSLEIEERNIAHLSLIIVHVDDCKPPFMICKTSE